MHVGLNEKYLITSLLIFSSQFLQKLWSIHQIVTKKMTQRMPSSLIQNPLTNTRWILNQMQDSL